MLNERLPQMQETLHIVTCVYTCSVLWHVSSRAVSAASPWHEEPIVEACGSLQWYATALDFRAVGGGGTAWFTLKFSHCNLLVQVYS